MSTIHIWVVPMALAVASCVCASDGDCPECASTSLTLMCVRAEGPTHISVVVKLVNNDTSAVHIDRYTFGAKLCDSEGRFAFVARQGPYTPRADSLCADSILTILPGDSAQIKVDSMSVDGTSCPLTSNTCICKVYVTLYLCSGTRESGAFLRDGSRCKHVVTCHYCPFSDGNSNVHN